MRTVSRPVRATLVALLAFAPLAAQDVYVDVSRGSDANPGTAALPKRSIAAGVAAAGVGATVFVYPGTYGPSASGETLPIGIGTAGPQAGITVRGIGAVVVDLAGSTTTAVQVGTAAAGGRLTNLTFRNSDTAGWWTRVVETSGSAQGFEIDRCVFDGVNRGIVLWDASGPDVSGFSIHNNVFKDLANDAINEFEDQGPNHVFNNTIVGKLGGPAFVGILSDAQRSRFANNLIVGMRDGFARGGSSTNTSFVANNLFANQTNWAGSFNGTAPSGNTWLTPLFQNRAGGDLRLLAASPLIDAGIASVPYRMDPGGEPGAVDGDRNGSLLPDVGAYELPVAQLVVVHDRAAGTVTTTMTGPAGFFGAALLALDEGLVRLPYGPLLLDLATTLAPLSTPVGLLPTSFGAPVSQPPGAQIVLQGVAFDAANARTYLATQQWVLW